MSLSFGDLGGVGQAHHGEPIALSALEFDVLWEHLGFGEIPLVLKVPSPGKTDEARARLVDFVWDSLDLRGLGTRNQLDERLEHLLHLLDRPEREVDGRLWVNDSVRLLAAASGELAVLATLSYDTVQLVEAEATGLARHALTVIPTVAAGPGQSITLRTADFEAAAGTARSPEQLTSELRARGVREQDATALTEMIGDVVRQGQFGAAARDRLGRRHRADRVISFFDTPAGRYLQVRRVHAGGEAWTTISPADHRRMLQHLTALHDEIATAVQPNR